MPQNRVTKTAMRSRFERTRQLDVQAQLRDCMDYLENPEILVAEFSDAYLTAEAFDNRKEDFCAHGQALIPKRRWVDRIVEHLIQHEDVEVRAPGPYRFRYLAREIVPLWSTRTQLEKSEAERRVAGGGLDYVGVIESEDDAPLAVLGVVQPREDASPYLSLLRLLTCLAEVSTEPQMERANRFLFKGALPSRPSFDLHVVLANGDVTEEGEALFHLTRDLAHAFTTLLREEWQFPNLVRDVLCLRMDPESFDGAFEVAWRT